MGRYSYSNRRTVEDCKTITTMFLNEHNYFDGDVRRGGMNWSRNGEETGSIGYEVSTIGSNEYIRFQYTQTDRNTDEKTKLDYKARLTWTPCYFGGIRWWFICPQVVNAHACGKRVGSLYLEGKRFGCRHCYNLTYASSQESHKYDGLFRKIGFTIQEARLAFPGV